MSIENREPGESPKEDSQKSENIYARRLEQSRLHSTELQKNVEGIQSAKYGILLLRLRERTENNSEIINNINELLDALDHQSSYGQSDRPISPFRQKELAEFLGEAAEALRWSVGGGNRPSNVDINLSKWELGKKK